MSRLVSRSYWVIVLLAQLCPLLQSNANELELAVHPAKPLAGQPFLVVSPELSNSKTRWRVLKDGADLPAEDFSAFSNALAVEEASMANYVIVATIDNGSRKITLSAVIQPTAISADGLNSPAVQVLPANPVSQQPFLACVTGEMEVAPRWIALRNDKPVADANIQSTKNGGLLIGKCDAGKYVIIAVPNNNSPHITSFAVSGGMPSDSTLPLVRPVSFTAAEVQPAEVQPAEVQPAEVQPAEVQPAEVQPAEVQPVPDLGEITDDINDRLEKAKKWLETLSKYTPTESTILDLDYFREQIGKEKVDDIAYNTQKPTLVAAALFEAMNSAATSNPPGTLSRQVVLAWLEQKKLFLEKIGGDDGGIHERDKTVSLWNDFLDEWQEDALKKSPDRFPDALKQAALIIAGMLNDIDDKSIEDVLNGTVGNGAGGGSSGGSDGYGLHQLWHEWRKAAIKRKVERIRRRHGI